MTIFRAEEAAKLSGLSIMKKASVLLSILFLAACGTTPDKAKTTFGKIHRESVEREFRAAWVASVANINWPSKPGLSTEQQKQEAIDMLNDVAANNMNAVILQVRPQADALYESSYEPWSYYLTGQQGKAPEPYYDPLNFWIKESHKRGIKLHAWINPYRAHHVVGGEVSEHSVVKKRPEMVVKLDNGMYWLEPTHPDTIDYTIDVVMDIVRNYDVDGIHFDDYFYPYPSYHNGKEFPDAKRYLRYIKNGGQMTQNEWRRDAVNRFVKKLYVSIKKEKRHVQLGISPFGIWRPEQPETIQGLDQYDKLFADAKLWLNEGWVDYFSPQLYWKINQFSQSYPLLLNWWEEENTEGRHVWPGMSVNAARDYAGIDESVNQIMINRAMLGKQSGMVFWNIKAIQDNPEFEQVLQQGAFAHQALVPASPWLDPVKPEIPSVEFGVEKTSVFVKWQHQQPDDVFKTLVYYRYKDKWHYRIFNKSQNSFRLSAYLGSSGSGININLLKEVAVIAIDRNGNESERKNIQVDPSIVKQAIFNG